MEVSAEDCSVKTEENRMTAENIAISSDVFFKFRILIKLIILIIIFYIRTFIYCVANFAHVSFFFAGNIGRIG